MNKYHVIKLLLVSLCVCSFVTCQIKLTSSAETPVAIDCSEPTLGRKFQTLIDKDQAPRKAYTNSTRTYGYSADSSNYYAHKIIKADSAIATHFKQIIYDCPNAANQEKYLITLFLVAQHASDLSDRINYYRPLMMDAYSKNESYKDEVVMFLDRTHIIAFANLKVEKPEWPTFNETALISYFNTQLDSLQAIHNW